MKVKGQDTLIGDISRIFNIFKSSNCKIRPHFILTGESGSGKSFTIQSLAHQYELNYIEVNAAQLTKEGTSGNSLSKALSELRQYPNIPTICFVDEFDKLFIAGNSNSELAHEATTGVQNEFLKVLESNKTSVFGDYGKYVQIDVSNVLFIFAGAFNGQSEIGIEELREFGVKTEFIGRVGLVFNTQPLSIDTLFTILDESPLLGMYLTLFPKADKESSVLKLKSLIQKSFDNNTLGARMINTLIHQYFIKRGDIGEKEEKSIMFNKKLEF